MTEQSLESQSWQPDREIDQRITEKWSLTPRENQVLVAWLLDPSPTYARVAQVLSISSHTVKAHLDHMREKARNAGFPGIISSDDLARRYLAEKQSLPPIEPPLPTD